MLSNKILKVANQILCKKINSLTQWFNAEANLHFTPESHIKIFKAIDKFEDDNAVRVNFIPRKFKLREHGLNDAKEEVNSIL